MQRRSEEILLGRLASDAVGDGDEARRSLAVGSVARGRLSPADAARLSPMTEAELAPFAPQAASEQPCPVLSVVVPAYNEEETLDLLWGRLRPLLDEVGDAELVVVDDGSVDGTWAAITRLAAGDERVRGVRLTRNFGHQAALSAGMTHARGSAVCFLDADLQDPPELVPELLRRWKEGYEVVYAVRARRRASLPKRWAYWAFYRLYRRLADVDVPLDSGDFALLDRRVVDEIVRLPESNRFLRGLRSWVGFRQVGVEYERPERAAGSTKYGVGKLVRLAADGVVAFSATPLRLASFLGVLTALAGSVYVAFALVARFFLGGVPEGWTSIIAVVLILGGTQLIVIGVLGEYLARVYDETKGRPAYLVAEQTSRDVS